MKILIDNGHCSVLGPSNILYAVTAAEVAGEQGCEDVPVSECDIGLPSPPRCESTV